MKIGGRVATAAILLFVIFAIAWPGLGAGATGNGRPAGQAAALADPVWAEYQDFVGASVQKPRIYVYTDPAAFAAAARKGVPGAPWAVGFYARGQVHVKQQATERDTRLLLRHELAHALLGSGTDVPLWFNEGFATYMETRTVTPGGVEAVARNFSRTAVTLLAFHPGKGGRVADHYAGARLAVEYLVATRGEESLKALVRRLRGGEGFDAAFRATYGLTAAELQNELLRAGRGKAVA